MNNPPLLTQDGRTLAEVRADFPMLQASENERPLIYFNSGATSLKPESVLQAMTEYYRSYGVNVARGVDAIGYKATNAFESVRAQTAHFIGARQAHEIVFTRNTTEALNLIAYSYGDAHVEAGDEIVVSETEHHANYVPWQELAKRRRAKLIVVKPDSNGTVTPALLEAALSPRTKIVALFHVSNVLGASNDLKELAALAHTAGAVLVADGAQGIVHSRPAVADWDVDFYAFSAHKLCGPTGLGLLYGKQTLLAEMAPWQFGGEMIDVVDVFDSTFAEAPQRFEAGTMAIAEVIGWGEAMRYIDRIGYDFIHTQNLRLATRLVEGLQRLDTVEIYNPHNAANAVVAYNIKGVHPHDAAGIYDREGISIRAGHHCNQPTMRFLGVQSTLRASLSFYNTPEEVDHFLEVSTKAGDFLDVLF
ncbi:MAG: SufS family cysteine desulfurase [Clostridia bacterium]|nr:SufS family cysteine desulfurase [Clostridia bacterium]